MRLYSHFQSHATTPPSDRYLTLRSKEDTYPRILLGLYLNYGPKQEDMLIISSNNTSQPTSDGLQAIIAAGPPYRTNKALSWSIFRIQAPCLRAAIMDSGPAHISPIFACKLSRSAHHSSTIPQYPVTRILSRNTNSIFILGYMFH